MEHKIDSFLKYLKIITTLKSLQRCTGFVVVYGQDKINLAQKLIPLCKLLQKGFRFELTDTIRDSMFEINENLAESRHAIIKTASP